MLFCRGETGILEKPLASGIILKSFLMFIYFPLDDGEMIEL